MPAAWIKVIPVAQLDPKKDYFIGIIRGSEERPCYEFWSRCLNNAKQFTSKPGIALRYAGDEGLRTLLDNDARLVAIEVPANAARRWTARKPVMRRR